VFVHKRTKNSKAMVAPQALIIEPDDLDFYITRDSLAYMEHFEQLPNLRIHRVARFSEARESLRKFKYDIIITESNLPDAVGQSYLEALKALSGDALLFVLTMDERDHQNYLTWGACDTINKEVVHLVLGKTVAFHFLLQRETKVDRVTSLGIAELFDESQKGILFLEQSGAIIYSNPVADRVLSSVFESPSTHVQWTLPTVGEDYDIVVKDTAYSFSKLSAVLGSPNLGVYTIENVSERKGRARRLRQHVMNLEGTVLELEEKLEQVQTEMIGIATKSRTRDLLFASLSHEIRTPLTSVIGYTDMLLAGGELESKHASALHAILKNGNYLLELLNNVMDFAKLESGKLGLDRQLHSIFYLLTEVEKVVRVRAEAKGLDLKIEYQFPLPEKILVDGMRLKQILINLVGNAIKFTYRGEVVIWVKYDATEDAVVFDVVDTGIGVPEKTQANLFELFHQGEHRYGSGKGFGLGLYLSQGLARCMGSEIQLVRTSSKGTTFSVSVKVGSDCQVRMLDRLPPLDMLARDFSSVMVPETLQGTILLAEDAPDARHLVSALLKEAGLEVYAVSNGQKAVEFLERRDVDLVLMDMQMPIMSGREAIRILRWKNFKKPIVAFTAEMQRVGMNLAEIQCDAFLSKPFTRSELYAVVARLLESGAKAPSVLEAKVEKESTPVDRSEDSDNAVVLPKYILDMEEGPEIFRTFIDQTEKRMEAIKLARQQGDIDSGIRVAHQMKSSGAFGFKKLGNYAGELYARLSEAKVFDEHTDSLIARLEEASVGVSGLRGQFASLASAENVPQEQTSSKSSLN
jgi:signal transduction histidine kinase/DNA-binding response OmpR family regulator/HPt (histidine-containing phosphotransfer) domain-containing protein